MIRQRPGRVLALMADGRTNTEIAGRLVLSDKTVPNHITNLFAKLGVTDPGMPSRWRAKRALGRTVARFPGIESGACGSPNPLTHGVRSAKPFAVQTGSVTSGTSGTSDVVRTRLWREGRFEVENFPLEEISDRLQEQGALVWLDLCRPDHDLLRRLAVELALDPHAVEDAIASGERPKATRHATHTFVTAYATRLEVGGNRQLDALTSRLQISRVSAFVLPHGIVTVRSDAGFDMDQVVQRWEDDADLLKLGSGALLHGLLDVIVDGHFETVQLMDDAIESLEDGLFDDKAVTREIQQRTYRVRKELVELRRVILPMREVVNAVQRHHTDDKGHSSELDGWYADLYDHVLRASEWTESLRDMVTTVFETNLSLQDARLNTVMKKLTGWAAIIAVPTAVTGWFGQNVAYPGFGNTSGLIASTIVITTLAGTLYIAFRRWNWL